LVGAESKSTVKNVLDLLSNQFWLQSVSLNILWSRDLRFGLRFEILSPFAIPLQATIEIRFHLNLFLEFFFKFLDGKSGKTRPDHDLRTKNMPGKIDCIIEGVPSIRIAINFSI